MPCPYKRIGVIIAVYAPPSAVSGVGAGVSFAVAVLSGISSMLPAEVQNPRPDLRQSFRTSLLQGEFSVRHIGLHVVPGSLEGRIMLIGFFRSNKRILEFFSVP